MHDRSLAYAMKGALWRLPLAVCDWAANRACRGTRPRLLIVRHPAKKARFYDVILDWVAQHVPEARGRFELRLLPCRLQAPGDYALHVPWLQDPVEAWSLAAYRQASALARRCDQAGIPVFNRVDRLANASKRECSRRLAALGIRTPRVELIDDPARFRRTQLGLSLPLIVREDQGHGGAMHRVDAAGDLARVPIEPMRRPVAIELIDVRCPADGLFRKFRYVAAGSLGVPHHLQTTDHWITRGTIRVHTPAVDEQEIAFISQPEPHQALFQAARQALGLDLVAFDYGFDASGRLVVWEANPFPHFHLPRRRLSYLAPAMHRTLAAVVHAYLERAGLPIPEPLAAILDSPAVSRSNALQGCTTNSPRSKGDIAA